MKNFRKVLSKTVASVYNAQPSRQLTPYDCHASRLRIHVLLRNTCVCPQGAQPLTYGFAIRGLIKRGVALCVHW